MSKWLLIVFIAIFSSVEYFPFFLEQMRRCQISSHRFETRAATHKSFHYRFIRRQFSHIISCFVHKRKEWQPRWDLKCVFCWIDSPKLKDVWLNITSRDKRRHQIFTFEMLEPANVEKMTISRVVADYTAKCCRSVWNQNCLQKSLIFLTVVFLCASAFLVLAQLVVFIMGTLSCFWYSPNFRTTGGPSASVLHWWTQAPHNRHYEHTSVSQQWHHSHFPARAPSQDILFHCSHLL